MRRTIALIALGLAGCSHQAAIQQPPTPVGVAIVLAAAEVQDPPPTAEIESRARMELTSRVGGFVKDLLVRRGAGGPPRPVQVGDSVTAGTVLARVSESGYAEKVSQAQARLAEARVDAVLAQQSLDRIERLTANRQARESELKAARLRLETAIARVEEVLRQVGESRAALDAALIRAPIDGVILERPVAEGTPVAPGTVCFVLGDTSSMKAVFRLPASLAQGLKTGGSLAIAVAPAPGPWLAGRIIRVEPSADPDRGAFEIELAIPNSKRHLTAGMIVSIKPAPRANAPSLAAVPRGALLRSGSRHGDDAVMVVEVHEGTTIARERLVRLGETLGDMVGVTDGLQPGESVIVHGAALVRDGGPIEIVPPSGSGTAPVPTSDAATHPTRRQPPRKT